MQDPTTVIAAPTPKKFNWRLFLFLCGLTFAASFLVIPYSLALGSPQTAIMNGASMLFVYTASQACCGVILWPLIALGLLAADRVGLGAPLFEALLARQPVKGRIGKALLWGIVGGIAGGTAIILLSMAVNPLIAAEYARLGQSMPKVSVPAPWQGFLASISAGITEEASLRLFLLSGLVWVGSLIRRTPAGKQTRIVFWIANILSAVVFGLMHLPLAASLDLVTTLSLVNTLVMNMLLGLVYGWLYDRYGLESAMLAHFSTDLVLHVLLPLLKI